MKKYFSNQNFDQNVKESWHLLNDRITPFTKAENDLINPWIQNVLIKKFPHPAKILDVSCGYGCLTNFLATKGHFVSGIDLFSQNLKIAKRADLTQSVDYQRASADALPFSDLSFDAVFAIDLLERLEKPAQVIGEASRVLKKDGLFFFQSLNRNFLNYFTANKGMHQHSSYALIKPFELIDICSGHKLKVKEIKGIRPDILFPIKKMDLFTESL